MPHTAYIAIGSNLGNRLQYCERAVAALRHCAQVSVVAVAPWREYPALTLNPEDVAPNFMNGVVAVQTDVEPETLLAMCQAIETQLGRPNDHARWTARTIDLDLLAFDDLVCATPLLTLPHPELHRRIFVLEPLAHVAPQWVHPVLQQSAAELLETLCNSFSTVPT